MQCGLVALQPRGEGTDIHCNHCNGLLKVNNTDLQFGSFNSPWLWGELDV